MTLVPPTTTFFDTVTLLTNESTVNYNQQNTDEETRSVIVRKEADALETGQYKQSKAIKNNLNRS